MSNDPQELNRLAQQQGLRVDVIHCESGIPAVLIEPMGNAADFIDEDDLVKGLAAGGVQAQISKRV